MEEKSPKVITISRQLGSGGAYIGQQLAQKLNILYLDREIVIKAANRLSATEDDLESREEKIPSFWEYFFTFGGYSVPTVYIPPQILPPTEGELFETESEIIKSIARERSSVIVGRCGAQILRDLPNHVSIFLYGDIAFRKERIQKLYDVSEESAEKMIIKSDKERARYIRTFTGKEMTDARQYDLSIDTSKIGVDRCVQLILEYLKLVFPEQG
jgi:cytidylate kinase